MEERICASMVSRRLSSCCMVEGELRVSDFLLAALVGLVEDGEAQAAFGEEVAVITAVGDADDAVVAVEGQRGQALVTHGARDVVVELVLLEEAQVVLAVRVGGLLRGCEVLGGKILERSLVGELDRLACRNAEHAGELNLVFGEDVHRGEIVLLALLVVDLRAEDVEADADAGVVTRDGLIVEGLGRARLRGGVGDVGLIAEDLQVKRADGEDDIAAVAEGLQINDAGLVGGAAEELEVGGEVEEHLIDADAGLRGVHLDDVRDVEAGRNEAGAGELGELRSP